MIMQMNGTLDQEDTLVLFLAMANYAEIHGDEIDTSLVARGHQECYLRALRAAERLSVLASARSITDDGVWWYEQLSRSDLQGLAGRLFRPEEIGQTHLSTIVMGWVAGLIKAREAL